MDKNKTLFEFPLIDIIDVAKEDIVTTSMFSREPAGYTSIDLGRRF